MNKKPSFWISIGIGVIVIIAVIFYFFFYKGTLNISVSEENTLITIDEKNKGSSFSGRLTAGTHTLKIEKEGFVTLEEQIGIEMGSKKDLNIILRSQPVATVIHNGPATYLAIDEGRESLVFIDSKNGQAYRASTQLEEPIVDRISNNEFIGVEDFSWSPDRLLAFYFKNNETNQFNFKRIDLVKQQIIPWPEGTKSIDWKSDGSRIAYYYAPTKEDPQKVIINVNQKETERTFTPVKDEKTLIIADINNLQYTRVFDFKPTNIRDPKISWSPDGQKILIQDSGLHIFKTELRDQIEDLSLEETVIDARWLPDSESIIFENQAGNIKIISLDGTVLDTNTSSSLNNLEITDNSFVFARQEGGNIIITQVNMTDFSKFDFSFKSGLNSTPENLAYDSMSGTLFFTSDSQLYGVRLDNGRYEL